MKFHIYATEFMLPVFTQNTVTSFSHFVV